MQITLKKNATDLSMIEMWTAMDTGSPMLMAVVHEDCFLMTDSGLKFFIDRLGDDFNQIDTTLLLGEAK